jgi:hypothetical protein
VKRIPKSKEELLLLVKNWGWTAGVVLLCGLILAQGLTLYLHVQSWDTLTDRVQNLLTGGGMGPKKDRNKDKPQVARSIDSTFFFRPQPAYSVSAILENYAVINGREVKVGDRIDKAVIDKINIGSVTIREDGTETPRELVLHPGL